MIFLGLGLVAFALLIIAGQMHIANELTAERDRVDDERYKRACLLQDAQTREDERRHREALVLNEQQTRVSADLAAAQHRALGHLGREEDDD